LLLCACVIFHYHFAGPAGVLPIIILGAGTYFVGKSRNKRACIAWIAVCTSALIFYKYTHFLFESAVGVAFPELGKTGGATIDQLLPALPPLGISFFTFEFVHYLIEIYRGHRPIKSPISFALFAIFWPSLVAGPIKRYRQYIVSLSRGLRLADHNDALAGIGRVTMGILKKLTSDAMTGWIAVTQPNFDLLPMGYRWLFVVIVGQRIFLDFSGYSDMAIGFARMMGIRLPENFNWPYVAWSISEFWRRWHISLSTWIRDYIYIPLGGSRHGPLRRAVNALLAMALCGLWHGAAWNFALWGLYHGLGLVLAGAISRDRPWYRRLAHESLPLERFEIAAATVTRVISWALTMLFVHIGWLLFFYPVGTAIHMTRMLLP
jgi:alginate O-acetyltransferase complex protein AlgI